VIEFLRKDGSRKPLDLARVVLPVPLRAAPSGSVELPRLQDESKRAAVRRIERKSGRLRAFDPLLNGEIACGR
jgi:hypothetical protein